ncbi:MAG: ABC transporter ATP-binding protein [Firmicutes bacterium]|jgi:branched-chain amino acid transport system ATP-binding protein|nr:ABC transporter ATP-binding protein [Bacillota bacterium]
MAVLEVRNLTIRFGGLVAVNNVTLHVDEGKIVGLIGPNGAGKTTIFNLVTGVYNPTRGEIHYRGRSLVGMKPHQVASLGVVRTFQNIRLFKNLTVYENVRTAAHMGAKYSLLDGLFHTPRYHMYESEISEWSENLLRLLKLDARRADIASSLPYGVQRRLEIARALALRPSLLLLDEPAAGMNPQECRELISFIREIRDMFGLTIFLIEHHMDVAMSVSERMYVLNFGELLAEGTPSEIQNDRRVIEAYLGEEERDAQG